MSAIKIIIFISFFVKFITALMDTIQIVQSLRNCIPAPTIPISSNSWKSEERNSECVLTCKK